MAEMVVWRRRSKRRGMLDGRRYLLPLPTEQQVKAVRTAVRDAAPCFFLALAEVLEMPATLQAAYIAGLAALGKPIRRPLLGAGLAMLLRWMSGLDPHWEGLITLGLLAFSPLLLVERGNGWLMLATGIALLPVAIRGSFASTAAGMVQAWAALPFGVLMAPVLCRGLKALTSREKDGSASPMDTLEDRLGAAALALMVVCGGARLLVLFVNVGMLMGAASVLLLALCVGAGAGCAAGILLGTALSLTGMSMLLAAPLAAAGFLAGMVQAMGRRWVSCVAFAATAITPMLLTSCAGVGCGAAVLTAAGVCMALPRRALEGVKGFLQRFLNQQPAAANAYAASVLAAWEKTVDAMALAVPSPMEQEAPHSPDWWRMALCQACPDAQSCTCMDTETAAARAEAVWASRQACDPLWEGALEGLRGLGCQRLYHLRESMDSLRQEAAVRSVAIRRAQDQRSMLVTHLTAMAGAARRFAHLSVGESWWDQLMAERVRRALAESASPARLMWVRRVQGHVQAAFELPTVTGARRQAEELSILVEQASGAPMSVSRIDADRVCLAETPPLMVLSGMASACITSAGDGGVCGDTAWCGVLHDGRCMAAISDGMGHGETAALGSRQTVELLRLCLDAGYTLQQTLTAVNGMMLLGSQGERFTTVDLMTIDLWTGHTLLEKLGAAATWLHQQGDLRRVTGDALPLGILESIESGCSAFRLAQGDTVILMTDGVEEAFPSRDDIENAILTALTLDDVQQQAECLLASAGEAAGGLRRDDQTIMFLRAEAVQIG